LNTITSIAANYNYITEIDNDNIRSLLEFSWSNFFSIYSQLLNEGNDSTNIISPIPVIKINGTEVSKTNDNNEETNRGRQSISRSRKTIKIANDMRKNLDEILTKKKKELEIINED
jgi:hypothetical protein